MTSTCNPKLFFFYPGYKSHFHKRWAKPFCRYKGNWANRKYVAATTDPLYALSAALRAIIDYIKLHLTKVGNFWKLQEVKQSSVWCEMNEVDLNQFFSIQLSLWGPHHNFVSLFKILNVSEIRGYIYVYKKKIWREEKRQCQNKKVMYEW